MKRILKTNLNLNPTVKTVILASLKLETKNVNGMILNMLKIKTREKCQKWRKCK